MISLSADNLPRFQPGQKPFYEVYFFKFHLLEEGISFWIRTTLHSPLHEDPYGACWAFILEAKDSGALQGGTQNFPLSTFQIRENPISLQWEGGEFAEGKLAGKVEKEGFFMEWDLQYEEGVRGQESGVRKGEGRSLRLYPYDWMYRRSFPKTKYLVPYPFAFFSGRIRCQGKEYRVERAPGEQAHIWGREHAQRWAWVHCNTFLEDSTAMIEGLSAQVKIGPFCSPPFNLFYLRLEGKEYPFNRPLRWFRNRSLYGVEAWDFDAIQGETRLMGSLINDPSMMIGVRYTDPNGSFRFCHHAEWAELRLGLYRRVRKRWEEIASLHSRAASYEVVDLEPDPQVKIKVLG